MGARFDYAVFLNDRLVSNAMLSVEEVTRMEADGYRCMRVRDTVGEGLPAFRGRRSVKWPTRDSRRWDR